MLSVRCLPTNSEPAGRDVHPNFLVTGVGHDQTMSITIGSLIEDQRLGTSNAQSLAVAVVVLSPRLIRNIECRHRRDWTVGFSLIFSHGVATLLLSWPRVPRDVDRCQAAARTCDPADAAGRRDDDFKVLVVRRRARGLGVLFELIAVVRRECGENVYPFTPAR